MEKNNISKKAICSRCTEEKIIASSGFGSESYVDLCADCLEASSNYAWDNNVIKKIPIAIPVAITNPIIAVLKVCPSV